MTAALASGAPVSHLRRATCAGLLLAALPACSGLWPVRAPERLTTVQFLSPEKDSECAVLRSHGDRVVVLFLTDQPRPAALPRFLAARGLSRVDDVVFTVAPRSALAFPEEVAWGRFWCPAAAVPVVAQCRAGRGLHGPQVVTPGSVAELDVPGVTLRLVPCGAGGERLLADLRHAGNRMVLLPLSPAAPEDLQAAAAEPAIDLLGLLPAEKVEPLRGLPALSQSRILVQGGAASAAAGAAESTILLGDGGRVLFQSAGSGLVRLRVASDSDT